MKARGKAGSVIAAAVANRWTRRLFHDVRALEVAAYRAAGERTSSPPESTRCKAFDGNLTIGDGELDGLLGLLTDSSVSDGATTALSNDQHGQGDSPSSDRRKRLPRLGPLTPPEPS